MCLLDKKKEEEIYIIIGIHTAQFIQYLSKQNKENDYAYELLTDTAKLVKDIKDKFGNESGDRYIDAICENIKERKEVVSKEKIRYVLSVWDKMEVIVDKEIKGWIDKIIVSLSEINNYLDKHKKSVELKKLTYNKLKNMDVEIIDIIRASKDTHGTIDVANIKNNILSVLDDSNEINRYEEVVADTVIRIIAEGYEYLRDNSVYVQPRNLPNEAPIEWKVWRKQEENKAKDIDMFLEEVWGKWLKSGELYLNDLRRLDPGAVNRLKVFCSNAEDKKSPSDFVPAKKERIKREVAAVEKDKKAIKISMLVRKGYG